MKKITVLLVLVFALFVGAQAVSAQQKPEEIAKAKVAELSTQLDLTGEQQRALFRVFVKNEAAKAKNASQIDLKAMQSVFEKELKAELTDEQHKKYLTLEQ